jgi:aldehyde:ferredoxin oxidoreductase
MIWNLDRSIWVLQGRHRDMEIFSDYVYDVPTTTPYLLPVYENGEWRYDPNVERTLDRDQFEEWKTKYYTIEGWNTSSGWPTRATLEELDLNHVADKLEAAGRLG